MKMPKMARAQKTELLKQQAEAQKAKMEAEYPQMLIDTLHKIASSDDRDVSIDSDGKFDVYLCDIRYSFSKTYDSASYFEIKHYWDQIEEIEEEKARRLEKKRKYDELYAKLSKVFTAEEIRILEERGRGDDPNWESSWS